MRRLAGWAVVTMSLSALVGCAEDSLTLPENAEPAVVEPVAGDGQEGRAGEWLGQPLVVEVRNDAGVPLPGVRVVFEFETDGSAGELDPAEARTNENGRAAARVRLAPSAGTQVIVATVDEPALVTTFELRALSEPDEDEDEESGGGSSEGGDGDDSGDGGEGGGNGGNDGGDDDGGGDSGVTRPQSLSVPYGHLPAPGQCRIWHPGRSPGQQPAPRSCSGAAAAAPAATWVLDRRNDDEVLLLVIDGARAGVVVGRFVYDARTGAYLRDG